MTSIVAIIICQLGFIQGGNCSTEGQPKLWRFSPARALTKNVISSARGLLTFGT